MATILDRIRQKATQAIQGVGNFIDRDPNMGGVQLAKGGLLNRVSNTPFTDARGVQTTVGQRAGEVAQDFNQNSNKYNIFSAMRERGLGTNTILDRPVQAIANSVPAKFLESRVIDPLLKVPQNIQRAADPNQGALNRGVAGLSAGAAFLPGIDDAVVATLQAMQERAAGTNKDVLSTDYQPTPLGDILRNRGQEGAGATALDLAELPLMLGSVLATGKGADALLKRTDDLAGGARAIDDVLGGAKETQNIVPIGRRPKNTMYTTPEGTTFKVNKQPTTTLGLDEVLKDVKSVISPEDKNVVETTVKALPPGKLSSDTLNLPSGKVLSPEEQAVQTAEDALRKTPKIGVQGTPKKGLTSAWDDLARSSKGVIENSGASGKRIRQTLEVADEEGALAAGAQVDDMFTTLKGLSNEEKISFADVVEGVTPPISSAQAEAVSLWNNISADIYKRAKEQGLDIGFIQKYFPHNVLKGDSPEARAALSRASARRFGNLELARQTDLPYDKDPSVLMGYIESANKRIAEAKHFGPNDEVLYNLANQAAQEGGDTAQITKYLDQILGKEQAGTLKDVSEKIRAGETIMKLNFGTSLTNLTQNLSTMLRSDAPSTIKSIQGIITNPNKSFSNARRTGEIGVDEARVLEDFAGGGDTVRSWLRAIGMLGAEKVNRVVSVNAFMEYASKLGRQAATGSEAAVRELKRLGFSDADIAKGLDEMDLLKAGRRGSQATQFSTAPGELPYAWHTPIGKIMTQFKSFAYKQSGLLKKEAVRIGEEARLGNFKPLTNAMITYGVAAPIVGEVVNDFKALITNKKREAKLLSPQRYVDNILGASSFGLLDSAEGLFGKYGTGGVVSAVAGPFASDVVKIGETVAGATSEDKYDQRKAARNMVGSIPLVGKTIANTLIPNSYVDNMLGGVNEGLSDKDKATYQNLQQSDPQSAELFKEGKIQSRGQDEPNFIQKLFGQKQSLVAPKKGASAEERKAFNTQVGDVLEAGGVPDSEVLKAYITKGKDAKSKSIEERTDAFKSVKSAMDNEYYSDEQKAAILESSGIEKNSFDYYDLASKDQDVRLQELLPKLDNMDTKSTVEFLMQGRRAIAGKQLVSNAMVDYLYENDYFGESEKNAIKALKYDEIQDKFYFTKAYKGKGGLTYKQARSLFKIDLPQFSSIKNINNLLGSYQTSAQTSSKSDTLIENILKGAPRRSKSQGLWF